MRRFIRWTDIVSVALAVLLGPVLLVQVLHRADDLDAVGFGVGLVLGYLLADIASGVVHWFCDTYFAPSTPFVGPMFIAAFREHHVDPHALVRHGIFERNGNNCLGALPVMILGLCTFAVELGANVWLDVVRGVLVGFAFTLCFTNQIHAWAHGERAPWLVRVLQQRGVLLSPEHHRVHHVGERNYAVVSGWSNRGLNILLPQLEGALARCGFRPSPGALDG